MAYNSSFFEQTYDGTYRAIFDVVPENRNKFYVKVKAPNLDMYERVVGCLYIAFSYDDPEAKASWEYKNGYHDGKLRMFDKKTNQLDIGLIIRAFQMLRKAIPDVVVEFSKVIWDMHSRPGGNIDREKVIEFHKSLKLHNKRENFDITPYDHQYKLFESGINGRRRSMVACTGAGKSLAQYAMSRWLIDVEKKQTLIIVPSAGLVEQMYHDFKDEYGWEEIDDRCTLIYADSKDKLTHEEKVMLARLELGEQVKLKELVISTWQSLLKKPVEFFANIGAVIVDEAHGAKAEELRRIVNQCVNAGWRLGVSGTIPDDGLDAVLIEGSIGRREEIVRSKELIAKGILTPVEVHSLMIPYVMEQRPFICRQDYKTELSLLNGNGSRSKILNLLLNAGQITHEQNTLILFRRKEGIENMKTFIEKYYPEYKIFIIQGDVKVKIREQYRNEIEKSTGNFILATYGTMKQGVNIKLLHNLMFAEFSKSMYEIIQSIGRILRKHKNKPIARVFDVIDNASYITKKGRGNYTENYAMSHYGMRKNYYIEENFPVIEFQVPFDETIDPTELDRKKKMADAESTKKSKKGSKKDKKIEGKGDKSAFML